MRTNNKIKKDSKKNSKKSSKDKNKSKTELKTDEKIQWAEKNVGPRNIYSDFEYRIEPIKLIYKYKNINRKNQYLTYIFLGVLGKKYGKILNRIENLNIYDTLLEITSEEELNITRKHIHIDDIEKGIKLFIDIKTKGGEDELDKDKFVHMYS